MQLYGVDTLQFPVPKMCCSTPVRPQNITTKLYPVAQVDGPLFVHTVLALPATLRTKSGLAQARPNHQWGEPEQGIKQ